MDKRLGLKCGLGLSLNAWYGTLWYGMVWHSMVQHTTLSSTLSPVQRLGAGSESHKEMISEFGEMVF